MSEIEIWKPIVGYEGLYEVSNLGRVRSLGKWVAFGNHPRYAEPTILKPGKCKGYQFVNLCNVERKNVRLCRLVAFAFPEICGEYFEGAQVNHKNEIVWDDRAENLEWCTPKYNMNYGTVRKRLSIIKEGKMINRPDISKSIGQYTRQWVLVNTYPSIQEVKRQKGYNISCICECCQGKQKSAYGYYWKYLN